MTPEERFDALAEVIAEGILCLVDSDQLVGRSGVFSADAVILEEDPEAFASCC